MNIDPVELLRAQGDLQIRQKQMKTQQAQQERDNQYSFVPDTKKRRVKEMKPSAQRQPPRSSQLNLDGIAKKKGTDDSKNPFESGGQPGSKFEKLYEKR